MKRDKMVIVAIVLIMIVLFSCFKKKISPTGSEVITPTPVDKILFVSLRDGKYEIYVINADGSNQVNLTNNSADDWIWINCWK